MKFAGKWKELENIILNEVTQTHKDKHDLLFHVDCGHSEVLLSSSIGSGSGADPRGPESPTAAGGLVTITHGRPQLSAAGPSHHHPNHETQQPPAAPAAALSTADTKPGSTGVGSGGSGGLISAAPTCGDKKVIATKVLGTVKWFNVRNGYSFINRNDTKEDGICTPDCHKEE
ncbi:hypothetical protein STEG23_008843 [Scotinomys teguina]